LDGSKEKGEKGGETDNRVGASEGQAMLAEDRLDHYHKKMNPQALAMIL